MHLWKYYLCSFLRAGTILQAKQENVTLTGQVAELKQKYDERHEVYRFIIEGPLTLIVIKLTNFRRLC